MPGLADEQRRLAAAAAIASPVMKSGSRAERLERAPCDVGRIERGLGVAAPA